MLFKSIIILIILIPLIQSVPPSIKLTFIPDEKYFTNGHSVEILCEIINPNEHTDAAQLWYVDFYTGKRTSISRSLLLTPLDDAPDIFKQNSNGRLEFVRKNHIRIRYLHLEDSTRYECNCPDCIEPIEKETKDLQVMKLSEPIWHIEPGWPLQENAKTRIICMVDDFYPYVGHKIIRHHHDITKEGTSITPNSNTYPQRFSWEATVTPTADWHNTTLQCTVTEGSVEQYAVKNLEVLFTPRFLKCEERQHVNLTKEKSMIECLYSGNPQPKLVWIRQMDEKPLGNDVGINIETKNEHHGKYKSILTFDRDKLMAIPLTTTTAKSPNPQTETTTTIQPEFIAENFYQQLLNDGFTVKLMYNNVEKGSKRISIISDVVQPRSKIIEGSPSNTIRILSTSTILFSFLITLYMINYV